MQIGCLCSSLQSGSGGERIAFLRDGRDDAAVTGKLRIWSGFGCSEWQKRPCLCSSIRTESGRFSLAVLILGETIAGNAPGRVT